MTALFVALLASLRATIRSRLELAAEILACRHQLAVRQRAAPKRPRLRSLDRDLKVRISPSGAGCPAAPATAQDGLHILRHTFCPHLAMRGAPPRAIQELAGHRELGMTQRYMHLGPASLDSAIRLLDQPAVLQSLGDILETGRVSEGKINGWNNLTGGEAGIRTLGRVLKTLQRFSKPPPSASRPPHRIELTIVAQGLADFRFLSRIVDLARLSLKLSLSRRRDAWRPREGRPRSRYCIARTRSWSCVLSSASRHASGCQRGRDCGRRFCGSHAGHDRGTQLPHRPIGKRPGSS